MNLRLTKNATDAMNASASCARQLGHDHIGSEHILLSILAIPQCQACKRFVALGLGLDELAESMRNMISGDAGGVLQRGQLPMTARTRKVIELSQIVAGQIVRYPAHLTPSSFSVFSSASRNTDPLTRTVRGSSWVNWEFVRSQTPSGSYMR